VFIFLFEGRSLQLMK